jgi:hypothetical protein
VPRSIKLAAAAAAIALALPLTTAQAAPAMAIHIDVETSFIDGGPTSGGPFSAAGPAVDAGLICPAGDTIDVFSKAAGYQSGKGWLSLTVVKEFTCGDGSGAFLIKLEVRLDQHGDHFAWAIVAGTGAYDALHGAGTGHGAAPQGDYDVLDVYGGMVANPT